MKKMCQTVFIAAAAGLIGCFSLLPCELHAQSAQQIKVNMKKRAPALDKLKAQGIIGEGNTGLLVVLQKTASSDDVKLVEAENADRKLVYKAIAKKEGTTVELVGSRRALQIHEIAKVGTMIQDEKGAWSKK